jgi:hypothetical protein
MQIPARRAPKIRHTTHQLGEVDVTFEWETRVDADGILERQFNDSGEHQPCAGLQNYMEIRIRVDGTIKAQLRKAFPDVCSDDQRPLKSLQKLLEGVLGDHGSRPDAYTVDGDEHLDPGPNVSGWQMCGDAENLIRLDFPADAFFERQYYGDGPLPVSTLYDHMRAEADIADRMANQDEGGVDDDEEKAWPHIFKTQMIPWAMKIAGDFLVRALEKSGLRGVTVQVPDERDLFALYDEARVEMQGGGLGQAVNWPLVRRYTESSSLQDTAISFTLQSMPVRLAAHMPAPPEGL